jgi:hypothetical protein
MESFVAKLESTLNFLGVKAHDECEKKSCLEYVFEVVANLRHTEKILAGSQTM